MHEGAFLSINLDHNDSCMAVAAVIINMSIHTMWRCSGTVLHSLASQYNAREFTPPQKKKTGVDVIGHDINPH